jgi:hypothetical protein
MVKEVLKFRHDSDNIPTAMGFDKFIDDRCREIVHFSAFTNFFIKEDFFDDEDEKTPENLTTITGILEKALSLCKTKEEEVYTLFVFRNVHEHCSQALSAYKVFEDETDEKQKRKLKMLMELVELKALSDDDSEREHLVTPKDMFNKIDIAKKNMYNFEDYYKAISNESKN